MHQWILCVVICRLTLFEILTFAWCLDWSRSETLLNMSETGSVFKSKLLKIIDVYVRWHRVMTLTMICFLFSFILSSRGHLSLIDGSLQWQWKSYTNKQLFVNVGMNCCLQSPCFLQLFRTIWITIWVLAGVPGALKSGSDGDALWCPVSPAWWSSAFFLCSQWTSTDKDMDDSWW